MDYEEKYKEALETVQEILNSGSNSIMMSRLKLRLQSVFPELKESKDEESKWTDEDEELLQHCCGAVTAADYYTMEDKEEMTNWLVSLKQRIGG